MRPAQTDTLCSLLSRHRQKQFQRCRLNCHHALDGFFSYQAKTQKPNRWSALGSFDHVSLERSWMCTCYTPIQQTPLSDSRIKRQKKTSVLVCFPCRRSCGWQLSVTPSPPIRMSASSPPVYSNLSLHVWQRGLADNFNIQGVIAVSSELVRMLCLQCYNEKIARNCSSLRELLQQGSAFSHVQTGRPSYNCRVKGWLLTFWASRFARPAAVGAQSLRDEKDERDEMRKLRNVKGFLRNIMTKNI